MTRLKLWILISGTLTIERSQEQDIGKYECVAENEIGVAYSFAAMLYVKSKYFNMKVLNVISNIHQTCIKTDKIMLKVSNSSKKCLN